MEFIFILFFHFLGNYVFQPLIVSKRIHNTPLLLTLHTIIYSLTLYITFPIIILILQSFSELSMNEFLITYELTNINKWNFDVFLYLFIGSFVINTFIHRLSNNFYQRYLKTMDWKWEYISIIIEGIDEFLHILHIYIIYKIIFY